MGASAAGEPAVTWMQRYLAQTVKIISTIADAHLTDHTGAGDDSPALITYSEYTASNQRVPTCLMTSALGTPLPCRPIS
eukprot:4521451-Prymnesium_polylepis.1